MRAWRSVIALSLVVAACTNESNPPTAAPPAPSVTAAAGSAAMLLPLCEGSTDAYALAISPSGWVIGHCNGSVQSWDPLSVPPWSVVETIVPKGVVRVSSNTDTHGDAVSYFPSSVIAADPATGGQPYTVVPLPAGTIGRLHAMGMNDDHIVVGFRDTAGVAAVVAWVPTAPGALTWEPTVRQFPLPTYSRGLGTALTRAEAINNAGVVVGSVEERLRSSAKWHAWVWRVRQVEGSWVTESVQELPWAPKATNQRANDINDAGVIAGEVYFSGKSWNAALWFPDADGRYTRAPVLSPNKAGDVGYLNSCGWLAYGNILWNGQTSITLPAPSGATTWYAYDVNDAGQVAGAGAGRAVLWEGYGACQ